MKITELTEELNEFFGLFDEDEPIEAPKWLNPKLRKLWEKINPVDSGVAGKRLKTQLERLNQMAKSGLTDMANKMALKELQIYYNAVKDDKQSSIGSKNTTLAKHIGIGDRYESVSEDATAGATTSGNIASVANPNMAYAKPKKRGKYGAPKAPQKKNPDGTAKNALDDNTGLMSGKPVKR